MALLGLDCFLKVNEKDLNSFNSTFNKTLQETVRHSYCLQNNEITKIQGEKNHGKFNDFIGSRLDRKFLLNFGIPLMNIEYVSWSSSDENSEKQVSERDKTLSQFPGNINIEVDFFMQHGHNHSLEITQMLKSGYSNDQQKLYRIHNSKITKKYVNGIALMEREHLDKWIGTMTCQKIFEALENDIIQKKLSADIQPRRFCSGRYWMLVAF